MSVIIRVYMYRGIERNFGDLNLQLVQSSIDNLFFPTERKPTSLTTTEAR